MPTRAQLLYVGSTALLVVVLAVPAYGANRIWVGANNDWNASTTNWNPADEPDSNDAAIFNTSHSVDLVNSNEAINGLTMSGGIDFDLNGNDMTVDGLVSLSGASTNLLVGPSGSVLAADAITINSGATFTLRGGTVTINEESGDGELVVNAGGSLRGHGVISLTDAVLTNTPLLFNGGTLLATSTAIDIGGSTAATLTIITSDVDARLDLDGPANNGVVAVARNDTLEIRGYQADPFQGTINLSAGATFDFGYPFLALDEIIINTEGLTPGTAGTAAVIAGEEFTQSTSSHLRLDSIDTLRFTSIYTARNCTIDNDGGTLILHGGGVIEDDVNVDMRNGAVLQGYGVINADVHGTISDAGEEQVLADNGELILNGDFSKIGIGTADDDAILNLPHGWNSGDLEFVTLNGGQITGANIDNDHPDGIRGHGRLSSQLWNETIVVAEGGGTLLIDRPGFDNNWDGATGDGRYEALSANLELQDTASESFQGGFEVHAGQEAFVNGFALHFQAGSSLFLHGGARYRCTHDTALGGLITVGAGTATIEIEAAADLSLAQATLTGDLVLDSVVSLIGPASQFSGAGALINATGRRMIALDGITSADLAVSLINRGTLEIDQPVAAGHTAGQIQGTDFEQEATGVWQVDIGGVGVNSFDRFNLTGIAVLDGDLDLFLFDGFLPSEGQTFNILSAAGGVTGAFDSVFQPAGMPFGLMFDVIYNPTLVQLQIVSAPTFTADFDEDGDVDGDDLTVWQSAYDMNALADADGDSDSDGRDFLTWQRQFGSGGLPLAASIAVPEPASISLALVALLALSRRRQQG